jgi:hypothetical protein
MEPELQMIGLDVGKPESKIDEPEIPNDEIELNPKINEQEIIIGDLKNETDEQDLKPLIIQLEQDPMIDEQNLLEDSLAPRYQITIGDAKVTKMHEYLKTRTSWFKYFQQDVFALGYLGFTIVCCGLNLYYLI